MPQYLWPISLLSLALVAIGALAGVSMLVASATTDPGAAVDGRPLPFLLGQLGARNLTMAGILLAAWLVGGPRVLSLVLAMRAATESLDLY